MHAKDARSIPTYLIKVTLSNQRSTPILVTTNIKIGQRRRGWVDLSIHGLAPPFATLGIILMHILQFYLATVHHKYDLKTIKCEDLKLELCQMLFIHENNLTKFSIAKIGCCQLMNKWNYKIENMSKRDF